MGFADRCTPKRWPRSDALSPVSLLSVDLPYSGKYRHHLLRRAGKLSKQSVRIGFLPRTTPLYREQERMTVPACNLAAVRARELRVDGLSAIQTFNLGDGRAAVNLGTDGVARSGRKGIGQVEELLASLLGRWMRSTCQIAVEPPFPKRSPCPCPAATP